MRDQAVRAFYLRPSYVLKQIRDVRTVYQFKNLVLMGFALVRENLSSHEPAADPQTQQDRRIDDDRADRLYRHSSLGFSSLGQTAAQRTVSGPHVQRPALLAHPRPSVDRAGV